MNLQPNLQLDLQLALQLNPIAWHAFIVETNNFAEYAMVVMGGTDFSLAIVKHAMAVTTNAYKLHVQDATSVFMDGINTDFIAKADTGTP